MTLQSEQKQSKRSQNQSAAVFQNTSEAANGRQVDPLLTRSNYTYVKHVQYRWLIST